MRDCSWLPKVFNGIKADDFTCQSDRDIRYNCIAWAAGKQDKFWWPYDEPGYWWPDGLPKQDVNEETVDHFIHAFATVDYKVCRNGKLSRRYEKIALYVDANDRPTHAARLLPSGVWSSKLGEDEDIEHKTLECLGGGYGRVKVFLKRRYPKCQRTNLLTRFRSFLSRPSERQQSAFCLTQNGTLTNS
jgi:hypothetical protein